MERFPNYSAAQPVQEVEHTIDPARFFEDFVLKHQPCIIRGAVAHWPATAWDTATLRELVGDRLVGADSEGVLYEPIVEYSLDRGLRAGNQMTFDQLIDEIETRPVPRVQLYAETLRQLAPLEESIGELSFLDTAKYPPLIYSPRFFFSRRGYTDWHVHFGDETITAQLTGAKEFLLLPPDNKTFDTIHAMAKRGVWKVPPPSWDDAFRDLTPHRAVLQPGDAVYIPMHWWHAAEAVGDDFNTTFARVFRTPARWFADVRIKNVRFSYFALVARCILFSLRAGRPRHVRPLIKATVAIARGIPSTLRQTHAEQTRRRSNP